MFHLEYEQGRILLIDSESIVNLAQVDEIRHQMTNREIQSGALLDLVRDGDLPVRFLSNTNLFELTRWRTDNAMRECFSLGAILLIPRISSLLQDKRIGRSFAFALICSGLRFFAFDRPELTQVSLIREIREAGAPLDRYMLGEAVKRAKKNIKSRNIRRGLEAAKARGVKLGNPNIAAAQARSRAASERMRPSAETVSLITKLREERLSLREIARVLNERGIKPPRGGQRWCHTSVNHQLNSS